MVQRCIFSKSSNSCLLRLCIGVADGSVCSARRSVQGAWGRAPLAGLGEVCNSAGE